MQKKKKKQQCKAKRINPCVLQGLCLLSILFTCCIYAISEKKEKEEMVPVVYHVIDKREGNDEVLVESTSEQTYNNETYDIKEETTSVPEETQISKSNITETSKTEEATTEIADMTPTFEEEVVVPEEQSDIEDDIDDIIEDDIIQNDSFDEDDSYVIRLNEEELEELVFEGDLPYITRDFSDIKLSKYEFTLLCQVVFFEAGACSIEAQAAVAACIFNRIHSDEFPSTIYLVIIQEGQFSTAESALNCWDSHIEMAPAIELALQGYDYSCGADYFYSPEYVTSQSTLRWFETLSTTAEIDGIIFKK